MREVPDVKAKICLFELLAAVQQGETVTITHNGKPIAHLNPALILDPSREPKRNPLETLAKVADGDDHWEPEQRSPVSESLRDLLDWRHYGRR